MKHYIKKQKKSILPVNVLLFITSFLVCLLLLLAAIHARNEELKLLALTDSRYVQYTYSDTGKRLVSSYTVPDILASYARGELSGEEMRDMLGY